MNLLLRRHEYALVAGVLFENHDEKAHVISPDGGVSAFGKSKTSACRRVKSVGKGDLVHDEGRVCIGCDGDESGSTDPPKPPARLMVRAITAVRDIERDGLCVFLCLAKGLEGAFHAPVALAACASPYPSRGVLWRSGCVADLSELELELYRHSLCLGSSSDGDSGRAAWPA